MLFPWLICLAAAQAPTNASSMHPQEPLFALEMPEVSKSLAAYERAPLIAMIRDADVRATAEKLEQALGFDLSSGVEALLASIGGDQNALPRDLDGLLAQARKVRSFSLSFSIQEDTPDELRSLLVRFTDAQAEVLDLTELVDQSSRNNGQPPASLASLSLDERLKSDPWGQPYDFELNAEGGFSIRSLGSDGLDGGAGSAADISADFDRAQWLEAELVRRWCVLASAQLDSPTAARETIQFLESWLSTGLEGEPRQITVQGAAAEIRTFRSNEMFAFDGWLMLRESTVMVGLGSARVDDVVRRLEARSPNFASSELMAKLARDCGAQNGQILMRGVLSTRALDAWTAGLPETNFGGGLLSMLSGTSLSIAGRMQIAGDRFITDVLAPTSSDSWFSGLASGPVTDASLAFIPGDAAGALITQIDGARLHERFMLWLDSMARESGKDAAAELAALEQANDFNLRRDVFDNLAGGMSMHVMPISTLGVPNIVIALELKDPAAFEKGMRGLALSLERQTEGRVQFRASKYRGSPTWEWKSEETEPSPISVSPTLAIFGQRAVISSTALFSKREIKRLLGEEPAVAHLLSKRTGAPTDAAVLASMDWGGMIGSAYKAGRGAMALAGGMFDLPIDMAQLSAALPEKPETFTRFFQPTMLWVRPIDGALHTHWEASFGPETWMGAAGVGAAVMRSFNDRGGSESSEVVATPAADTSERDATSTALDLLATRLVVYQLDQGRFPDVLSTLALPTESYPQGFLDGQPLPNDGWGRAFAYRALEAGTSFRLWSFGPDGVDDAGSRDDIVAK